MTNPRYPEYEIERGYRLAQEFMMGKITEKEYFSERKDDASRDIYAWPELIFLKEDMELFRKYLLTFSKQGRINIFLQKEMIGMPLTSLNKKYGIPKDKIRALKGQHSTNSKTSKVEIRKIGVKHSFSFELLANMAIFSKVPVSWYTKESPDHNWTIEHFQYLSDSHLTTDQFFDFLNHTKEKAIAEWKITNKQLKKNIWFYDIRGIILNITETQRIYLRIAFWEDGGFIIEVFSVNNPFYDFLTLNDLLKPFGSLKVGYVHTLIKERINFVISCQSEDTPHILPPDFCDFSW